MSGGQSLMYILNTVLSTHDVPDLCRTIVGGVAHQSDNFVAVSLNEEHATIRCAIACDIVTLGIAYKLLYGEFNKLLKTIPEEEHAPLMELINEIGEISE